MFGKRIFDEGTEPKILFLFQLAQLEVEMYRKFSDHDHVLKMYESATIQSTKRPGAEEVLLLLEFYPVRPSRVNSNFDNTPRLIYAFEYIERNSARPHRADEARKLVSK